jgi:hypothetical protein
MARPTRDQVDLIHYRLEQLASRYESRNNPNGWDDLAGIIELLDWVDDELGQAKNGAAYGPGGPRSPEGGGTIGANTIGRHGLNRPVEARFTYLDAMTREHGGIVLNDTLVKDLTDLRRAWAHQLGQLRDSFREDASKAANWPMRTEQVG